MHCNQSLLLSCWTFPLKAILEMHLFTNKSTYLKRYSPRNTQHHDTPVSQTTFLSPNLQEHPIHAKRFNTNYFYKSVPQAQKISTSKNRAHDLWHIYTISARLWFPRFLTPRLHGTRLPVLLLQESDFVHTIQGQSPRRGWARYLAD